ncbi:MAG: membrane protein YdbS with pleckstrin-like domain [Verrucomicrobiales bacterium]|jgi:membrane protein YdbS with pleckstrin-like domain
MAIARASSTLSVMEMEHEFRGLDRRVVTLWRWHRLFSTVIVASALTVGCAIAVHDGVTNLVWLLALVFVTVMAVVGIFWYPRAAYARWQFHISPQAIELQSGVIFQQEVHVPMDRVQHVDLERGPLERKLGLARVIFFTAGTKSAQQEIPGLAHDEAMRLRDQIANELDTGCRTP